MLLKSLFLLLLSNGLTTRKDTSILNSRVAIFILINCIILAYDTFYLDYTNKGIGLYNGLFNATALTHTFQIFILLASSIILLLTGFYPRKLYG
ncbi:MAG: hypothetical protein EOP34_01765 [Rickettsiales bacterium]|nr:MAG: hypothetical protein EOP34_01765 [Rickettsiales bacterium]